MNSLMSELNKEMEKPEFLAALKLVSGEEIIIDKEASIGGPPVEEELPPIDFGRVAAQSAKQVIVQKVRDAERERHYEEFKDRVGEIISGVVKRVEYN